MGISKKDTAVAGGVLLLLLATKKALASTTKETPKKADDDGAKLLARATQANANRWVTLFVDHPVSPLTAAALARWAGIESSGNATAHSRLDERGLMQAGASTVAEGGMSATDWSRLINSATTNKEQVALAVHYVNWLFERAAKYIAQAPKDPVDQVWYAKLYHQRPVDVRDGKMHGAAADMARELAERWKGDAKAMHRLRAANVVAWGTSEP